VQTASAPIIKWAQDGHPLSLTFTRDSSRILCCTSANNVVVLDVTHSAAALSTRPTVSFVDSIALPLEVAHEGHSSGT
jgi:hypothetical protein